MRGFCQENKTQLKRLQDEISQPAKSKILKIEQEMIILKPYPRKIIGRNYWKMELQQT
jgi:hypothetical protein